MTERMIRVAEVMNLTSLSRPTIYRLMAQGAFPKQRRLSHKISVWSHNEVSRWIDEKLGLLV